MRYICHLFDIRDRKERVCGALHIHCLYIIIYRRLDRLKVRSINDLICYSEILKDIIKYPERPSVYIVGNNKLIARLEQRQYRIDGCEPCCKCKSVFSLFKIRYKLLESVSRRISGP